jgi:prepilin-type N-terminal cleavage/methylation domain-containing protein
MKKNGYSLIELSVVLVIVGVLLGLSLSILDALRNAKVNRVVSDMKNYDQAITYFNEKYRCSGATFEATGSRSRDICACSREEVACVKNRDGSIYENAQTKLRLTYMLPGDIGYATEIWGSETHNGNHSGTIETVDEQFRVWQHLYKAGLISGKFTGDSSSILFKLDGSLPPATVDGGYSVGYEKDWSKVPEGSNNPHYLILSNVDESGELGQGIITSQEAREIDTKLDDGSANSGYVIGLNENGGESCLNEEETNYGKSEEYDCTIKSFLSNIKPHTY